jgi:hypothetical protein
MSIDVLFQALYLLFQPWEALFHQIEMVSGQGNPKRLNAQNTPANCAPLIVGEQLPFFFVSIFEGGLM